MTPGVIYTVLAICAPFVLLTLWAIFDSARRDFGTIEKKAVWVLVSAIPFIGFVIYLVFGMRKGRKEA
jgi:hypothetical protein